MAESSDSDGPLSELMAITGLPQEEAQPLLAASGGDLAMAVQLHFDQEEGVRGAAAAANYGGGGDFDDDFDDGEEDFPEALDANEAPPMGAPGPGARLARSPEPPADDAVVPRFPRLFALYGWMARYVPFFGLAERLTRMAYRVGIVGFVGTLLWAPLALIGLAPTDGHGAAPAGPARPFVEWFEEHHGPLHPRFFRGSCQSALSRSKSEAKFLLAYLHDHAAPECAQFCSAVLASQLFTAFCDENFVLWVGEMHSPEGRAVRRALRVSQHPAVVMLAHGGAGARHGAGSARAGRGGVDRRAVGAARGV